MTLRINLGSSSCMPRDLSKQQKKRTNHRRRRRRLGPLRNQAVPPPKSHLLRSPKLRPVNVRLTRPRGQRRGKPWERRSGPSSTRSCTIISMTRRSSIRARSRACSTVARTRTVTRYVVSKLCIVGRASFVLFPVIFGYCGVDFCSFPFAFPLFACSTTTSFFRCCVA